MQHPLSRHAYASLACALLAASAGAQAPGRFVGSIEWQSSSTGLPDGTGAAPLTEGDLLAPTFVGFGPLPRMTVVTNGAALGLPNYTTCAGHAAGTPCGVEVDAHSHGTDSLFRPTGVPGLRPRIYWSVDEYARGVDTGSPLQNRLPLEASAFEAASDVYTTRPLLVGPLQPGPFPLSTLLVLDGNGLPTAAGLRARGLGLIEPIQPGTPADSGDNLDALSLSLPNPSGVQYYSVDGALLDPFTGINGSNTAGTLSTSPAAVLRRAPGAAVTVYATPAQLGLDLEGFGTDDLDALVLADDGDGVYEPSLAPNDWVQADGTQSKDMLLFSVRRGSRVIGRLDSLFNLPIEPGDILTTPVGGLGRPAIYIPAEAMGMRTQRSGAVQADDVDALAVEKEPYWDCNQNGVEDSVDIAQGASSDNNQNSIPDECEDEYVKSCFCTTGMGPCGNDEPTTGCRNSTGVGAALDPGGSTSLVEDDLTLTGSGMPPNAAVLMFLGPNASNTPFGDGRRCVGSPLYRLGAAQASAAGVLTRGPGIGVQACAAPGLGCFALGSTWRFQFWYRNAANYCTSSTFNLTNAVDVTFTP